MANKRIRDESGKFVKSNTASETPEEKETIPAADAIAEEKQRINDEEVSDFLGEEVKDNKVVEEKPAEVKKEEVKVEPKEEEEEIDIDKFKQEIKEDLKKETDKEITDKLTAAGVKPTEAAKDKYEAYAEKFAKEKGRNPSCFEFVPFLKDEVKAELKKEQEEATKQTEVQKKQIAETNAQRQKAFDAYVDEQLNDLYASGKLVKGDEKARTKLFQTMMDVNTERVKTGIPPIYSVKEIFYEHYTPPSTQPAGANEPISIGRGSTQTSSDQEIDYARDIKGKSFIDVLMGRK
jgi:hypothetical protein